MSNATPAPADLAAEHADILARIADPGLRERLARLATVLDDSVRAGTEAEARDVGRRQPALSALKAKLPSFSDAFALPNAFLRAALFPALDTKRPRQFVKNAPIFAVGDWSVTFTGEQFDQGDLDVLAGILEIGTPVGLGSEFKFSSYRLLKVLGKQTGGEQYAALHESIIRLTGGTVVVQRKRGRLFFGHFIERGETDAELGDGAREYTVKIHTELGALFGFDMWSRVDREQRRALGKNGAAKALHGYYSSHAAPGAHRYETLAAIAGLQNKQKAGVKRRIIKAHDALKSPECGFLESYEAGPETISVCKQHTASQLRHLAKRAVQRREKRRHHAP